MKKFVMAWLALTLCGLQSPSFADDPIPTGGAVCRAKAVQDIKLACPGIIAPYLARRYNKTISCADLTKHVSDTPIYELTKVQYEALCNLFTGNGEAGHCLASAIALYLEQSLSIFATASSVTLPTTPPLTIQAGGVVIQKGQAPTRTCSHEFLHAGLTKLGVSVADDQQHDLIKKTLGWGSGGQGGFNFSSWTAAKCSPVLAKSGHDAGQVRCGLLGETCKPSSVSFEKQPYFGCYSGITPTNTTVKYRCDSDSMKCVKTDAASETQVDCKKAPIRIAGRRLDPKVKAAYDADPRPPCPKPTATPIKIGK